MVVYLSILYRNSLIRGHILAPKVQRKILYKNSISKDDNVIEKGVIFIVLCFE